MRFDGKIGLITGAGSGIGRRDRDRLCAMRRIGGDCGCEWRQRQCGRGEIAAFGGNASAVVADLTKPADIEAMVAHAMEKFGRLDMLHNNAFGVPATLRQNRLARSADIDQAVWDYTIQVGLTAVMQATRAVLPIMQRQGGGAIVNTASISGLFADYGIAAYNVMKAGVINLTRVVAIEYAPHGIRCNCVCPGAIDTPLLQRSFSIPGFADATKAAIPMGRLGRPDEMANVVSVPGIRPRILRDRRSVRRGRRIDRQDRHPDALHRQRRLSRWRHCRTVCPA